ncbi:MAG TPA: cytochrome c [Rhodopila sp.]|nr:cytochrome c [Rhodopila sp.]
MPRRAILPNFASLVASLVASLAASLIAALVAAAFGGSAQAASPQIERGKYLVEIMGCTDCHTPGHFLGHPDETRYLGGSDVGFAIPGLGVFVGPNLTPDETGLGKWTARQIVTAITKGERPDGRILAPSMPWRGFSALTQSDAMAIAAFLKTVPPVKNKVPGPFGPNDTPTVFVMSVQPAAAYAAHKP